MFNNEQKGLYSSTSMDPRISFSNEFADTRQAIKCESSYREAPVSSDFEFSVKNYSMIPADEIFLKGVMLPLKDNCTSQLRKMTLRDKLLVDDDNDDAFPAPKNSGWWKDRLGLKRSHIVHKKGDRNNGVLDRVVEEKTPVFVHEKGPTSKRIQQVLLEGELSCIDKELCNAIQTREKGKV